MTARASSSWIAGLALALVGSVSPAVVMAHSEGVEAADPNTPAAVLTFDGAARGYTALRRAPADWGARSSAVSAPMAGHAGHASHAGHGGATEAASSQHQQQ